MIYNFTDLANSALQTAVITAQNFGGEVGTEHILYGILSQRQSKASKLLYHYKITTENFMEILEGEDKIPVSNYEFTPRCKEMFLIANTVAKRLNSNYISTEHLLLAILSQTESYAVNILGGIYKVNVFEMRQNLLNMLNPTSVKTNKQATYDYESNGFYQVGNLHKNGNNFSDYDNDYQAESELPEELKDMGTDLTARAKAGKIDPIIGREKEIERVIEILCRKTKNNPVLIGEAGVGKSAIVEGLAVKIVKGEVPTFLQNKIIYSLNIGEMMAGTKYRGAMEEKLKNLINIITNNKNIITFIDEIHTLAQAGSEKGETSPADMLKPYLARGEMQTIGATTTDEYRKFIEKDKALERRFQPILVNAPSVEDTIKILKGIRDSFEAYHKVKITDEAIVSAVELSDKYIVDRSLPDKAIDCIDEASSRAKVKANTKTDEDKALEERLIKLEANKEDAVNQEDFEKASKLRDEIALLKRQISKDESLPVVARDGIYSIGEKEIAEVISKWTNIPVSKLTEGETEKLINLESILKARIKGQDEAISVIAKAIRRSRIKINTESKRPIGSFLFLGTTGVGKTEVAKALAEALFDGEDKMIRFDMSEFMESHSVSKLIGSPPGYVGFEDAGQLTEAVRRKPYSVVLFDEIEKAHPDVFNVLLQILEDGRLTDSHGRVVSFRNTIIILTSNIGSDKLNSKRINLGFKDGEQKNEKEIALDELKKFFRPELINRIDNIVVFNRLSKDVLKDIAKNMIAKLSNEIQKSNNITIALTDSAYDYLIKHGTNEDYGARPLRRLITSEIEDELADLILKGDKKEGDNILIDCVNDKLIFN